MSGHKQSLPDLRRDHGRGQIPEQGFTAVSTNRSPILRMLGPIAWVAVLVGLVVWSAVAWIGYASVDNFLSWAGANAGIAVDSGKTVASAVGVGKEVVGLVDALNVGGILSWAIPLLQTAAKPAIIVLWGIGVLAFLAAPLLLSRVGRLFAARRH